MTLLDAAFALDDIAAGREPSKGRVIAGALALDTLCMDGAASSDLLDAAAALKVLATGGTLDLSAAGEARAASLAEAVRQAAKAAMAAEESLGTVWWNDILDEGERGRWQSLAGSDVVSQAFAAWKATAVARSPNVRDVLVALAALGDEAPLAELVAELQRRHPRANLADIRAVIQSAIDARSVAHFNTQLVRQPPPSQASNNEPSP